MITGHETFIWGKVSLSWNDATVPSEEGRSNPEEGLEKQLLQYKLQPPSIWLKLVSDPRVCHLDDRQ